MQLTTPAPGKEPGLEHASTGMPEQCTAYAPTHSMRIVVKNFSETFVKNAAVNSGVIIKKNYLLRISNHLNCHILLPLVEGKLA